MTLCEESLLWSSFFALLNLTAWGICLSIGWFGLRFQLSQTWYSFPAWIPLTHVLRRSWSTLTRYRDWHYYRLSFISGERDRKMESAGYSSEFHILEAGRGWTCIVSASPAMRVSCYMCTTFLCYRFSPPSLSVFFSFLSLLIFSARVFPPFLSGTPFILLSV